MKLPAIWDCLVNSEYLHNLGCEHSRSGMSPVLNLYNVEGVPDGSVLTASRELYDQGLDDINYDVRFASYSDPVHGGKAWLATFSMMASNS